ncbi:MAG: septal ring lytic transglycosylase RlpA family protein [Filomicrobium sp.]
MLGSSPCSTEHPAQANRSQTVFSYMIAAALTVIAGFGSAIATSSDAEAKRPGSTYCFVGKCHRVKSLNETQKLVGKTIHLVASHYNDCRKDRFNPCGLTSSGERFHPNRPDNAASPIYPDGTVLLVRNPKTNAAAVLRINNAGPYWGNRKLDVSYAAAKKLGFVGQGVAKLETRILKAPNRKESRYSRRRAYRPLPGFIGKYKNLEKAEETAVALMVLDASAASVLAQSSATALAIAARREGKAQRQKRLKSRKKLEPIVKSMQMIASLEAKTATPNANVTESIQATPSRVFGDSSPATQLANVALSENTPETQYLKKRVTKAAVKILKTAEVGAPRQDAWQDLFSPRLGLHSLISDRVGDYGRLPYSPPPRRKPFDYLPPANGLARDGMTG